MVRILLGNDGNMWISGDMWLYERKGENFIVQILFGRGVMCKWGMKFFSISLFPFSD